ncbi:MAG TPA: ABC transporter permease [Candidatus Aminicenantes bacterium]|nr:ABC transporter permease [Candidatus Aminicenantes bacterium]
MIKLLENLKTIYRYRGLIQSLVGRELKARYRGTVLGFLWSFINPLLLMIIYTIVFGFIIGPRDPAFNNNPILYALFLFCGVLPWTWFSSSSLEAANVLMIQGNLIKKVLFPAEVLPIVVVTSNFIHFLFGLPILFGAKALISCFVPNAPGFSIYLVFLPYVILVQYIFTLGLGLFLSALTVHFRDIKDILANLLTFWFFASPIIYPMTFGPIKKSVILRTFLNLNPITHIMVGYQNTVYFGEMIRWKRLSVTLLVAIIIFIVGYHVFDKLRDSFPEEV